MLNRQEKNDSNRHSPEIAHAYLYTCGRTLVKTRMGGLLLPSTAGIFSLEAIGNIDSIVGPPPLSVRFQLAGKTI